MTEPEISHKLDNLVHIGIDETSHKKEHKYITVIVNHDTNTVVWVSLGHGKSVLKKFYQQLTPEQLASIKVVTVTVQNGSQSVSMSLLPIAFAALISSMLYSGPLIRLMRSGASHGEKHMIK